MVLGAPRRRHRRRRTKRGRPTRHHVRLSLETLEDRLAPSVSVLGSFNGMSNTGYSQPNTSVAAGPNYVVETVNSSIAIYNKATGALVSQETLATLFNGLVTGDSGQFDPSVLYDDQAGRFVVAAQVYNSANQTSFVDIAVSSSSDPTQGFAQIHQIEVDDGWHYWSDNGKLGFNADAYVFSGNLAWFTQNGQYDDVVVTINKNSVLGQNNSTFTDSVTYLTGYASLVPARMHGSAPGGPMWLVETSPGGQQYDHRHAHGQRAQREPTFTDFLVPVNSYTEAQTNPLQPGGTIGADDCRALNVEWNNNNLVTAFNGGVGSDAAADWVEFSTSGSSPALVQQGDIHPAPGTAAYMPSIAVDALGDLGVTYMQSSATQYVSMYVTGRLASDPLGTLEAPALVAPGTSTMTNRVGDWSGISLDPSSPNTFWAGNEYGANFWSTWLCQFQLTASGTGNPPTVASPATAAPKPVAGTTTMLSVLGADASGESSLTYTWSLLSGPAGAPVPTFSANGTNARQEHHRQLLPVRELHVPGDHHRSLWSDSDQQCQCDGQPDPDRCDRHARQRDPEQWGHPAVQSRGPGPVRAGTRHAADFYVVGPRDHTRQHQRQRPLRGSLFRDRHRHRLCHCRRHHRHRCRHDNSAAAGNYSGGLL